MKNILLVLSSPRGADSYSNQIANHLVEDIQANHPKANVTIRDVASSPLPHVGSDFVSGLYRPADQRTDAEAAAIGLSDKMIDELLAADVVVLAVPMYNLGLPSTLKAWIDHVVRAGRTFSYSEKGPQGLVKNKKAIIVAASGGIYSTGPAKALDFQETYLRGVFGFIGITDVQVVRVEGVSMGEEAVKNALASANRQSAQAVLEIA